MFRMGSTRKKVILLLNGGLSLILNNRLDGQFKVIKAINKEWNNINNRTLERAIRNLYLGKMIGCRDNSNGTTSIVLSDKGKNRALLFDIDKIKIKKQEKWDGLWRMVIFDIPENQKMSRDALVGKLKELGFYSLQKSVFLHPYNCQDEIDFIIEIFKLRKYVRFLIVKRTDVDTHLKKIFKL
jgi:DNA-binding transcriptional regulator PaaX